MARKRTASTQPGNPWPDALYALRDKMGWDQAQAAAQIPVHRVTWAKWETGSMPDSITKFALRCLIRLHAPEILKKLGK